ncbi:MAG: hypothetical protein FDZ69_08195 [Deltaproteobacteria bacterium]|nr:MAG: hypothetical protein FDZ69_08195 [Deltaproteobacteria bacterium]
MGEHELREALCREARTAIDRVWQAAEATVAAQRAEAAAAAAARHEAAVQRQAVVLAAERRALLARAEQLARQRQQAVEAAVLARLHRLAVGMLRDLDRAERRRLWPALAAELLPAEWQRVGVHPDDLGAARQRFPSAEVHGDEALGGGLFAATADGRITVDNSLAGRLERCWPELQTALMAALHEGVDKDAAGPAVSD